ncbi:hypothetical protein COCVIDRAFT_86748 [Bipolaris victoriae FI3]|uniref:Tyrosinase copper-binding domain-containing protein n=1 Tax=Bipolaris victoriae (strain FI3) TaxID=930091 RepID=W7F0M8_BIPV3|nr:hypothetical protein COCVIDRAFT_86748 [Bipolaris victoriae FI3]
MAALNFRALYALFVSLSLLSVLASADPLHALMARGRPAMNAAIKKSATCTKDKLRIRREWGDLSAGAKLRYISAVKCLMKKPSKLDPVDYPGAKSRYDDFIVVHMKQTPFIHGTGNFLTWHRYYMAMFEETLRNECHYNGTQPYWNWPKWSQSLETSPLFDGSPTSLGGQGYKTKVNGTAQRPAGEGGGCIASGPFKGLQMNLGPRGLATNLPDRPNPRADGFGYNPRCVRRDISSYLTRRDGTMEKVVGLILNNTDIGSFQTHMQGNPSVHSMGHYSVGVDPGSDIYASPGDVYFWFHHGMIDLVYAVWQALDFPNRQQVISGGTLFWNGTDSRRATLNDTIDMDILRTDKPLQIKDLVSTVDGPFCYLYE